MRIDTESDIRDLQNTLYGPPVPNTVLTGSTTSGRFKTQS